jgi:Uma2 family endonuclease
MVDAQVETTQQATGVTLEDYMEHYAAEHYEYVEGTLIMMSPATLRHNALLKYMTQLLDTYFEIRPIGKLITQAFVMRLPEFPNRRREPDLLIVLNDNPHALHETYLDGPADLCIEIVSEESAERDHGEKFIEYEKGGVKEYWIVDPLREECRFYRLDEAGRYRRQTEDVNGNYHPAALPGLAVHVPILWSEQLPGPAATVDAVRKMLS